MQIRVIASSALRSQNCSWYTSKKTMRKVGVVTTRKNPLVSS